MNLVIIDSDVDNIEEIINNLVAKYTDLYLRGYSNNIKKGFTLIKNIKPDILYLNLSCIENSEVYINEIFALDYPLIIFGLDEEFVCEESPKLYLSRNIKTIVRKMKAFLKNSGKEEILEKKFFNISPEKKQILEADFKYLDFNFSLRGTKYIMECIFYIISMQNRLLVNNLNKNVYSVLASYHHTSVKNIKWSIIKSINNMFYKNVEIPNKLNYYFEYHKIGKPTAKIVINTFITRLIS